MYTPVATRRLVRLDGAGRVCLDREAPETRQDRQGKPVMADSSSDALQDLREHSRKALGFMIGSLLTNGEPSLVAQARQARSSVEQAQCYDAIRELRLKGRVLQEQFVSGVLAAFDELPAASGGAPGVSRPQAAAAAPGAGGLSVVQDALLEQQITVDNIAGRATQLHREILLGIGHQLARRTGSRRVDIEALPIGPQILASTFMDSCARAGVEPGVMQVFSRLFLRFVIEELGPFYHDCFRLFPPEPLQSPDVPVATGRAEDSPAAAPAPAAPAITGSLPVTPEDTDWDSTRTPLLLPPGKAMAMPRNQLEESLVYVQESLLDPARSFFSSNTKGGVQPLKVPELINEALTEAGFTRPMSLPADVLESMGLMRLLFEHTLRDARVPAAIRRTIRLLEVPLLRVALREPDVLTLATHPARVFLSELSAAATGRAPVADPANDDFPRLVQLLVMRVLGDYERDCGVFQAVLHDLRRYVAVHGGGAVAQAAIPSAAVDAGQPAVPAAAPPLALRPAAVARPPASPEFHHLVEKLATDAWIELRPQGAPRRRLQLVARVPRTGMFVFADAEGTKAGEWSRNDLASMIENGEAVILKSAGAAPPGRR